MKELIVNIIPKSIFPSLHSDTLFGAICFAMEQIYGEEKLIDIIKKFSDKPPFLLSSTFPCINYDKEKIYFLPKPIDSIEKTGSYSKYIDAFKNLDSVKYVTKDIFNDWINDRIDGSYILQNMAKYNVKMGLLFPKEKQLKFSIKNSDVSRNQINRLNDSTSIYYFSGYHCKNVNLFFMIRIYDEEYESLLKGALRFLRDRGFGQDISVGKGEFDIGEFSENAILELPKNQKRFITLSRYIPSVDEYNMFKVRKEVFYDICAKRGRSLNGSIKKQVHFFTEGSTFPNLKNSTYGRILHVQEKSVEYGLAFNVGF